MESVGIHTSAMLVELSISTWTARKLDKRVSQEIDADKGAKARAGNYNKNLMAGTQLLDGIIKYAANVRAWHNKQTLPWSDSGLRLLPMASFIDYKARLGVFEAEHNKLVETFLLEYPNLVSAAAFTLGTLFNREDYPVLEKVKEKFGFRYFFSPVPMSGDFRVDTHEAALRELHMQYENEFDRRLQGAMKEAWTRLYECLDHMRERLTDDGDKSKIIRDSVVANARELIEILPRLNVTNDPKLEQARVSLAQALVGIDDAKELRDNKTTRLDVRMQVEEILNKFDF